MVAVLDSKRKSFFIIENIDIKTGAKAISLHSLSPCSEEAQINFSKFDLDDKRYTWHVCPHLAESDRVYEYYISSGRIIIVSGKCFCEDCLDMILSKSDLSDFVHSSKPMTDRLFQENFVNPLIVSNSNFTDKFNYIEKDLNFRKTWICCPHLSTRPKLDEIYSNYGQIHFFEDHVICHNCFNLIQPNRLIDILYKGEAMTNGLFQETIVNSLYAINHERLIYFKHHGWHNTIK